MRHPDGKVSDQFPPLSFGPADPLFLVGVPPDLILYHPLLFCQFPWFRRHLVAVQNFLPVTFQHPHPTSLPRGTGFFLQIQGVQGGPG